MFRLNVSRLIVLVVCLGFLAGVAAAGPISIVINVFPSVGPNPYGSPSLLAYEGNALAALQSSASQAGTAGTPAYYAQTSSFTGTQVIGTDFNSWLGQAPPTGNYVNEFGNMLFYGMLVQATNTTFNLTDITFQDTFYATTSLTEYLSSVGFGPRLIGITSTGDTCAPAGSAACTITTPLKTLYFSGFGDQFYIHSQSALAGAEAAIQAATWPYSSGTYTLTLDTGQTYTGEADLTPEPGTMALAGLGLVLAGILRKRLK